MGIKLLQLDLAVWEVRRYCQVLNYEIRTLSGEQKNMLLLEIQAIDNSEKRPPQQFRLIGGSLERIIDNKRHPAREPLLWNNLRYGLRTRKRIKWARHIHSANSPLSLHPEILDDVAEFVHLPKDVERAYREELRKRKVAV
jgi:hypothetical protein